MTKARIPTLWRNRLCLVAASVLWAGASYAQLSLTRQKYDSIAAQYKNEHYVVTEQTQKLVIREVDGQLDISNTLSTEKLFISNTSLSTFNADWWGGGTYSYMTSAGANAWIPEGNDYRMVRNLNKLGQISPYYTGLQKGTVTRTSFVRQHEEPRLIHPMYIGDYVPVLHSVLEIKAPSWVKMGFLLKGADTSRVKRTTMRDGGYVVYRFTADNVPAVKEFDNVPNYSYYGLHVIPYIKSFRMVGAKKDSVITGSLDAHAHTQYDYINGINYKTDTFLTKKTAELIRGAYTEREKVERIYDWVQNNFHYESIYLNDREGFVPNPADTVLKRKYGDCKDMSSIISAMVQTAGIPAYLVSIGTRAKPYKHDELLNEIIYDHMVCAVNLEGKWYFPDGTTHVQPLDANRSDLQGKEALIQMSRDKYKVVTIPEASASDNVTVNKTVMNIAYNDVSGTTYHQLSGYPAWTLGEYMRELHRKEERDEVIRAMTMVGNRKYILKDYNTDLKTTGRKDASITTNYMIGDYVQRAKNETFVNMNLSQPFANLRVNDDDRKFPLYLQYKKTVKETVVLNVPKGARISYVPKNAKGGADGILSYNISYKVDNAARTVTMTREYVLKTMTIQPAQFAALNKVADKLNELYKETVVLTGK